MIGEESLGNDVVHDFEEGSSDALDHADEESPDNEEFSVLDVVAHSHEKEGEVECEDGEQVQAFSAAASLEGRVEEGENVGSSPDGKHIAHNGGGNGPVFSEEREDGVRS